jgi:hypothetical protein
MPKPETREVFLPAKVLDICLAEWDDAPDDVLALAVGETMEHAFLHLRWLLAVRKHRCRLVVVQLKNPRGEELDPHHQVGELSTLSGWHPERALEEARELLNDSGDGLTFDLPIDDEMLRDWDDLAEVLGLEEPGEDEPNNLELLASAMVLLDDAHDTYVQDLGDDFYIATRGYTATLNSLEADPFGGWSADTMQVVDSTASVAMHEIYVNPPAALEGKVPVVFEPEPADETEEEN